MSNTDPRHMEFGRTLGERQESTLDRKLLFGVRKLLFHPTIPSCLQYLIFSNFFNGQVNPLNAQFEIVNTRVFWKKKKPLKYHEEVYTLT